MDLSRYERSQVASLRQWKELLSLRMQVASRHGISRDESWLYSVTRRSKRFRTRCSVSWLSGMEGNWRSSAIGIGEVFVSCMMSSKVAGVVSG